MITGRQAAKDYLKAPEKDVLYTFDNELLLGAILTYLMFLALRIKVQMLLSLESHDLMIISLHFMRAHFNRL